MKILQINTTVNTGSTGRITEDIGSLMIENGNDSYIAYGRGNRPSKSKTIKIGNQVDVILHGLKTAIFDLHGFGSADATRQLIKQIDAIQPDLVGLHNIHGYYINIEILFTYLSRKKIPVLWTLFDCWSFTGHCTYFDDINCTKWETGCYTCPKINRYPASYIRDNSKNNYQKKRAIFNSLHNLNIVVHSNWLKELVGKSYLKDIPVHLIRSGIDLDLFKPGKTSILDRYNIENKQVILGCASIWDKRKGLDDFIALKQHLHANQVIILVGLKHAQVKSLPVGIIGIQRTESIQELAALYAAADVFVNPTWQDNFPTTNLEALACGTPVITYNTGGSPEAIDEHTGYVVEKGNVSMLNEKIQVALAQKKDFYTAACRNRALQYFNKDERYNDYLTLYKNLLLAAAGKS